MLVLLAGVTDAFLWWGLFMSITLLIGSTCCKTPKGVPFWWQE